jgi:hypothetical protein
MIDKSSVGWRTAVLAVAVLAFLVPGAAGAHAAPAPQRPAGATTADEPELIDVAPTETLAVPESLMPEKPPAPTCEMPTTEGAAVACVEVGRPHTSARTAGMIRAGTPLWCLNHRDGRVYALGRMEACEYAGLTQRLWKVRNGVTTQTGELHMDAISYAATSTTSGQWHHELATWSISGWGDSLNGTMVHASALKGGSCNLSSAAFPAQPMLPFYQEASGDARFTSTVSQGAAAYCNTGWAMQLTTPAYPPTETVTMDMATVRCDRMFGAYPTGCVWPSYPGTVVYDGSRYPNLVRHVRNAQASGLPGVTIQRPLTYTTNVLTRTLNRLRACGDAPSIAGKSCDEYPPHVAREGLSAGGTRRSPAYFGCDFPNIPPSTDPRGASVCMIPEAENSAQGGIHTGSFRRDRILDGDPFTVIALL